MSDIFGDFLFEAAVMVCDIGLDFGAWEVEILGGREISTGGKDEIFEDRLASFATSTLRWHCDCIISSF